MATGLMKSGVADALNTWLTANVKCVMILDSYTFSAAHDFLDDISADAAVNGTSGNLTVSETDGVLDITDFTITPDTAQTVDRYFFYEDTGAAATSTLLWHVDTTGATNLPLVTDGSAVNFTVDNGANKFFAVSPVLT